MQPAALPSVASGGVPSSPPVAADPGVAALRLALTRVVPGRVQEVLDQLLERLGPCGSARELASSGRSGPQAGLGDARTVARVMNLKGLDEDVLAAFDKPVWRGLEALAKQRGLVLPRTEDLPGSVEIRGVSGRPYYRDSSAFIREMKSLQDRRVAVAADKAGVPGEDSDDEEEGYETHEDVISASLNCAAKFPDDGDVIACRHLVADWILRRQAHRAQGGDAKQAPDPVTGGQAEAKSPKRFSYAGVVSAKLIAGQVSRSAYESFEERISSPHCARSIVHLSRFSDFVSHQFAAMESGESRHFFFASMNHAMGVELRCKPDEHGASRYVLNFYDPNRTVTSRRVVFDHLEKLSIDARDLLSESDLRAYFGDSPDDRAGILIRVDGSAGSGDAKSKAHAGPERAHLHFTGLESSTGCAPSEMFLRALWGEEHGLDQFLESRVLLASDDSASNLRRLQGRSGEGGRTALAVAAGVGHAGIANKMLRAAEKAVADGRLTPQDHQQFLQEGQGSQPS